MNKCVIFWVLLISMIIVVPKFFMHALIVHVMYKSRTAFSHCLVLLLISPYNSNFESQIESNLVFKICKLTQRVTGIYVKRTKTR